MTTDDVIDLRSDTVTRPSPAMRRAMAEAEVGDDVLDGDPTVARLEARVAELLGKPRALFFPTGTMANQAAVWLLARRGTEVLVDAEAHVVHWEHAGLAALCGVQPRPVAARPGRLVMDAEALAAAVRPDSPHAPRASLVCLENTHNGAGGVVTPLGELRALADAAGRARPAGAPRRRAAVERVRRHRHRAGRLRGVRRDRDGELLEGARRARRRGARRRRGGDGRRVAGAQAHGRRHAAERHPRGRRALRARPPPRRPRRRPPARARLAAAVDGVGGARVVPPDTNIVMVDLPAPVVPAVVARAAAAGVRVSPWSATRLRAVTHRDAGDAAVARAGAVLADAIGAELGGVRPGGGRRGLTARRRRRRR
jgi:threonine aldolase